MFLAPCIASILKYFTVSSVYFHHQLTLVCFSGWESLFYIYGGCACVFMMAWQWLVSDTPESCRWISKEELSYIEQGLPNVNHQVK